MKGIVSHRIEPVDLALVCLINVCDIISQQRKSVDHAVHSVEAIVLNSIGDIITVTCCHIGILHAFGESVEPGTGSFGIDCSELEEDLRVV